MEFVRVRLNCLRLLGVGLLFLTLASELGINLLRNQAYADDAPALQHGNVGEDSVERYSLTSFQSLLLPDLSTAFVKLAKVAKTRFGVHPLAEEWKQLYFHMNLEGKGSVANMRRLSELEIQILTDVDAEKHFSQIQRQRKILAYYDKVVETLKTQGKNPENIIVKLDVFQALLLIEPSVAREELSTLANVLFPAHPLAAEWTALYFRLSRDKKGSVEDLKRLTEIEIQILSDVSAEKHATRIQQQRENLKRYDEVVETLNSKGKTPENVVVEVHLPSVARELRDTTPQMEHTHDEADKHHRTFVSLISTDAEGAKEALSKYVKMQFGEHPLAEEWKELYFLRVQDGETTLAEDQRYLQLEIQILTDVDAEKHAKRIREQRKVQEHNAELIERLAKDGINPDDVKVEISFR